MLRVHALGSARLETGSSRDLVLRAVRRCVNHQQEIAVRFSPLVDRIAGEQTGAWRVHAEGMRRREAGHDVIFLTVGDPDQAAPEAVIEATIDALRRNRT